MGLREVKIPCAKSHSRPEPELEPTSTSQALGKLSLSRPRSDSTRIPEGWVKKARPAWCGSVD